MEYQFRFCVIFFTVLILGMKGVVASGSMVSSESNESSLKKPTRKLSNQSYSAKIHAGAGSVPLTVSATPSDTSSLDEDVRKLFEDSLDEIKRALDKVTKRVGSSLLECCYSYSCVYSTNMDEMTELEKSQRQFMNNFNADLKRVGLKTHYDSNEPGESKLSVGDSISNFQSRISNIANVILVLSERYKDHCNRLSGANIEFHAILDRIKSERGTKFLTIIFLDASADSLADCVPINIDFPIDDKIHVTMKSVFSPNEKRIDDSSYYDTFYNVLQGKLLVPFLWKGTDYVDIPGIYAKFRNNRYRLTYSSKNGLSTPLLSYPNTPSSVPSKIRMLYKTTSTTSIFEHSSSFCGDSSRVNNSCLLTINLDEPLDSRALTERSVNQNSCKFSNRNSRSPVSLWVYTLFEESRKKDFSKSTPLSIFYQLLMLSAEQNMEQESEHLSALSPETIQSSASSEEPPQQDIPHPDQSLGFLRSLRIIRNSLSGVLDNMKSFARSSMKINGNSRIAPYISEKLEEVGCTETADSNSAALMLTLLFNPKFNSTLNQNEIRDRNINLNSVQSIMNPWLKHEGEKYYVINHHPIFLEKEFLEEDFDEDLRMKILSVKDIKLFLMNWLMNIDRKSKFDISQMKQVCDTFENIKEILKKGKIKNGVFFETINPVQYYYYFLKDENNYVDLGKEQDVDFAVDLETKFTCCGYMDVQVSGHMTLGRKLSLFRNEPEELKPVGSNILEIVKEFNILNCDGRQFVFERLAGSNFWNDTWISSLTLDNSWKEYAPNFFDAFWKERAAGESSAFSHEEEVRFIQFCHKLGVDLTNSAPLVCANPHSGTMVSLQYVLENGAFPDALFKTGKTASEIGNTALDLIAMACLRTSDLDKQAVLLKLWDKLIGAGACLICDQEKIFDLYKNLCAAKFENKSNFEAFNRSYQKIESSYARLTLEMLWNDIQSREVGYWGREIFTITPRENVKRDCLKAFVTSTEELYTTDSGKKMSIKMMPSLKVGEGALEHLMKTLWGHSSSVQACDYVRIKQEVPSIDHIVSIFPYIPYENRMMSMSGKILPNKMFSKLDAAELGQLLITAIVSDSNIFDLRECFFVNSERSPGSYRIVGIKNNLFPNKNDGSIVNHSELFCLEQMNEELNADVKKILLDLNIDVFSTGLHSSLIENQRNLNILSEKDTKECEESEAEITAIASTLCNSVSNIQKFIKDSASNNTKITYLDILNHIYSGLSKNYQHLFGLNISVKGRLQILKEVKEQVLSRKASSNGEIMVVSHVDSNDAYHDLLVEISDKYVLNYNKKIRDKLNEIRRKKLNYDGRLSIAGYPGSEQDDFAQSNLRRDSSNTSSVQAINDECSLWNDLEESHDWKKHKDISSEQTTWMPVLLSLQGSVGPLLSFLESLESKLQERTVVPFQEMFDVYAGSGDGAILQLALLKPADECIGSPAYSPSTLKSSLGMVNKISASPIEKKSNSFTEEQQEKWICVRGIFQHAYRPKDPLDLGETIKPCALIFKDKKNSETQYYTPDYKISNSNKKTIINMVVDLYDSFTVDSTLYGVRNIKKMYPDKNIAVISIGVGEDSRIARQTLRNEVLTEGDIYINPAIYGKNDYAEEHFLQGGLFYRDQQHHQEEILRLAQFLIKNYELKSATLQSATLQSAKKEYSA